MFEGFLSDLMPWNWYDDSSAMQTVLNFAGASFQTVVLEHLQDSFSTVLFRQKGRVDGLKVICCL